MSFKPVRPFEMCATRKWSSAITIGLNRPTKRGQPSVRVVLRPWLIAGIAWLAKDAPVSFEVGEGDHAGLVRLAKGGDFRLGYSGGGQKGSRRPFSLLVPLFGTPAPGSHAPNICDFRIDADGALIITLPSFLRAKPAVATVTAPKVPFSISAPSQAERNAQLLAASERNRVTP